jgi:hypothetical protein
LTHAESSTKDETRIDLVDRVAIIDRAFFFRERKHAASSKVY